MKPLFARWLAVMLALCLFLSLAPAALTEEAPENAVFEEAEAIVDEDVETQPDGDAADQEVVSEPVDAVPEEGEDIDLSDLPMFEAQSNDDELDLDALEAQPADDEEGAGFISAAAGVAINKANFPDDVFRAYVSDTFDQDDHYDDGHRIVGKDGILDSSEIEDAREIKLCQYSLGDYIGMGIQSLQGIKFFTNLYWLECNSNQLTKLDVSGCSSLKYLLCNSNQLTKLDVSGCSSLDSLWCNSNQLTKLDVSGCPALESLHCSNNQLTKLDVSSCPSLTDLVCSYNQLTTLDVSVCPSLESLWCNGNKVTTLNLSNCTVLLDRIKHAEEYFIWNIWNIDSGSPVYFIYVENNSEFFRHDFSTHIIPTCLLSKLKSAVSNGSAFYDGQSHVSAILDYMAIKCENDEHGSEDAKPNAIGKLLVKDKDYSVSYYNERTKTEGDVTNAGIITVTVTGVGMHSGTLTGTYRIDPQALVDGNVTITDVTDSSAKVTVKDVQGKTLSQDVDYTVNYTKGSDGRLASVTVQGIGNYTSTVTRKVVPGSSVVPPSGPSTDFSAPTIAAVSKNSKATVTAAPGTVCTLDLGGATGKKFKSSKKKVATVNAAGQVTVKGAGKTKITFKVGKKTRTVNLTVKDPTIPTSVMLSVSSTAVKKGDVITLTPVIPEGTNTTFKWKSSNKKVATVSNGVVTFKKAGKVTITCTAVRGKKKVKVKFKVSN